MSTRNTSSGKLTLVRGTPRRIGTQRAAHLHAIDTELVALCAARDAALHHEGRCAECERQIREFDRLQLRLAALYDAVQRGIA